MLNSVNTAYKRIIFIMKTIIHYRAYIYNIHNVKIAVNTSYKFNN